MKSFVELSLSPVFRRAWSSLYKSLERSEPPAAKLMQLYTEHLPVPESGDHRSGLQHPRVRAR